MNDITINPFIKKHLIPLKAEEYAQLEENIVSEGCRDPLVLWGDTLVDGHNRYSVCTKHNLKFDTISRDFEDLDAVIEWMEDNQLGRRNLTKDQFTLLLGRKYNRQKSQGKRTDITSPQNDGKLNTAERVAAEHGVSKATVERAGKAAEAIDSGSEELQEAVQEGKVSVSAAADVASLPKEKQTEIVAKGEKEILEAAKQIRAEKTKKKRSERIEKIAEISQGNTELNTGKTYPVIYADPPWRYEHSETESRAIENQYPTMSLDDICGLDIPATQDAILFLWTTAPKLEEGLRVVKEWGFNYRSCAIWDKQKIGMGYYFRIQHEILLIATKGSIPTPEPSNRPRSVISLPYDGHSAKPHEIAEMIEAMYPELPKLEMFCRSPRNGWDVWGNQSAA